VSHVVVAAAACCIRFCVLQMDAGGIKFSNEVITAAGTEKTLNPREVAAQEHSVSVRAIAQLSLSNDFFRATDPLVGFACCQERIYQQGQIVQKLREKCTVCWGHLRECLILTRGREACGERGA